MHHKILVIGCSGSGKSTYARALAECTKLPLVHLDRLYWRPGWTHVSREEFDALLAAELAKPAWIMDGNYDRTLVARLERCDAVVWLNLPRIVCVLGVLRRVALFRGRVRPDMGDNCPERLDFSFLRWVWNYNSIHRARIQEALAHAPHATVFMVRKRRELSRVTRELTKKCEG